MTVKAIVFDFNRTLYDPDSDALTPGALGVLQALAARYPLALYSKKGEGRDERVAELGLPRFFKKIIRVEIKSPADFLQLARELGVKPGEVLVVGDRVRSELRAGKEAGCRTAWVRQGKFAGEGPENPGEEPDYVLASLPKLPGILPA